ncbi:MAG: ABC transporter permease [Acidobacteriota bacterium]
MSKALRVRVRGWLRGGSRSPLWPTAVVLVTAVAVCAAAPLLAPHDPNAQPDPFGGRLQPPGTELQAIALERGGWMLADRVERTGDGLRIWRGDRIETLDADDVANLTPDGVADRWYFPLGSDAFSRDVLSRWLYGGRLSILIGVCSVALSLILGLGVGATAALGGRAADAILMRIVDGILSVPWFFLLIALRAVLPPSTLILIIVLGATSWMGIARLARSEIMSLRQRDFVHAARGLGLRETTVFLRHILPNAATPLAVSAVLTVGYVIVAEAALSFLGLGVPTPHASWGTMIEDGRHHMARAWWLLSLPAGGLVALVLTLHLFADRLRDAMDPRRRTPASPSPFARPSAGPSSVHADQ